MNGMMEFSVIVLAIIFNIAVVGAVTNIYPPCATVAFTTAGQLDTGYQLHDKLLYQFFRDITTYNHVRRLF